MNILTIILIELILCLIIGYLGKNRKFGFWGYFFSSLLFTPLVGLLFVIASSAPRDKCDKQKQS